MGGVIEEPFDTTSGAHPRSPEACTIESILANCITVWWGNCSVPDQKVLQRVARTAQRIPENHFLLLETSTGSAVSVQSNGRV